jgi:hypothetical protein
MVVSVGRALCECGWVRVEVFMALREFFVSLRTSNEGDTQSIRAAA